METDIFKREPLELKDLNTYFPITIEFANGANTVTKDTRIFTNDGARIEGVVNLRIELDAEEQVPVAILRILNPKITGRTDS